MRLAQRTTWPSVTNEKFAPCTFSVATQTSSGSSWSTAIAASTASLSTASAGAFSTSLPMRSYGACFAAPPFSMYVLASARAASSVRWRCRTGRRAPSFGAIMVSGAGASNSGGCGGNGGGSAAAADVDTVGVCCWPADPRFFFFFFLLRFLRRPISIEIASPASLMDPRFAFREEVGSTRPDE